MIIVSLTGSTKTSERPCAAALRKCARENLPATRPSRRCLTAIVQSMERPRANNLHSPLLRRRIPPRPPDIARRIAKPLDHHGRQILRLAGHAGAGAHGVAVLMRKV